MGLSPHCNYTELDPRFILTLFQGLQLILDRLYLNSPPQGESPSTFNIDLINRTYSGPSGSIRTVYLDPNCRPYLTTEELRSGGFLEPHLRENESKLSSFDLEDPSRAYESRKHLP